jgi:hypothetical protein
MLHNISNTVPISNYYPTSFEGSESLGISGTTPFYLTTDEIEPLPTGGVTSGDMSIDNALAVAYSGDPIKWWIAIAVLLVVLMWAAKRLGGDEGNYGNLRLSAYNIFVITLSAIIGLSTMKVLFTKYPVPGLTTVIMSS